MANATTTKSRSSFTTKGLGKNILPMMTTGAVIPTYHIRTAQDLRDLAAAGWPGLSKDQRVAYIKLVNGLQTLIDIKSLNFDHNRPLNKANLVKMDASLRKFGWVNQVGDIAFCYETADLADANHKVTKYIQLIEDKVLTCADKIRISVVDKKFINLKDHGMSRTLFQAAHINEETTGLANGAISALGMACHIGLSIDAKNTFLLSTKTGVKSINLASDIEDFLKVQKLTPEQFKDAYKTLHKAVSKIYAHQDFIGFPLTKQVLLSSMVPLIFSGHGPECLVFLEELTRLNSRFRAGFIRAMDNIYGYKMKNIHSIEKTEGMSIAIMAYTLSLNLNRKAFVWPEGGGFSDFGDTTPLVYPGVKVSMVDNFPKFYK